MLRHYRLPRWRRALQARGTFRSKRVTLKEWSSHQHHVKNKRHQQHACIEACSQITVPNQITNKHASIEAGTKEVKGTFMNGKFQEMTTWGSIERIQSGGKFQEMATWGSTWRQEAVTARLVL